MKKKKKLTEAELKEFANPIDGPALAKEMMQKFIITEDLNKEIFKRVKQILQDFVDNTTSPRHELLGIELLAQIGAKKIMEHEAVGIMLTCELIPNPIEDLNDILARLKEKIQSQSGSEGQEFSGFGDKGKGQGLEDFLKGLVENLGDPGKLGSLHDGMCDEKQCEQCESRAVCLIYKMNQHRRGHS